jgi:hypothetical protein
MLEQFNVRVILDGLDELEDRCFFLVFFFKIYSIFRLLGTADLAPERCCILSATSASKPKTVLISQQYTPLGAVSLSRVHRTKLWQMRAAAGPPAASKI